VRRSPGQSGGKYNPALLTVCVKAVVAFSIPRKASIRWLHYARQEVPAHPKKREKEKI
jgi:hypothetical protein